MHSQGLSQQTGSGLQDLRLLPSQRPRFACRRRRRQQGVLVRGLPLCCANFGTRLYVAGSGVGCHCLIPGGAPPTPVCLHPDWDHEMPELRRATPQLCVYEPYSGCRVLRMQGQGDFTPCAPRSDSPGRTCPGCAWVVGFVGARSHSIANSPLCVPCAGVLCCVLGARPRVSLAEPEVGSPPSLPPSLPPLVACRGTLCVSCAEGCQSQTASLASV
jgi:hypothetical protein